MFMALEVLGFQDTNSGKGTRHRIRNGNFAKWGGVFGELSCVMTMEYAPLLTHQNVKPVLAPAQLISIVTVMGLGGPPDYNCGLTRRNHNTPNTLGQQGGRRVGSSRLEITTTESLTNPGEGGRKFYPHMPN